MRLFSFVAGSLLVLLFTSCNNGTPKQEATVSGNDTIALVEQTVSYNGDSTTLNSYLVYDSTDKHPRPAVLVVPEWWGLTDYPKVRARQLARLGYIALAVDIYGDGKTADNPDSATKYSMPFYIHPEKAKARIDAAIAKLGAYTFVDTARIGAIGYCFGGGILLNTVRLGDNLKGVVSFHGSLLGTPARKDLLRTKLLICQGKADQFVTPKDTVAFKKQMDSIGASYTFISYDSAMHSFTNPASTAAGLKFHLPIAYNAKADSASWDAMKTFFRTTL